MISFILAMFFSPSSTRNKSSKNFIVIELINLLKKHFIYIVNYLDNDHYKHYY